VEFLLFILSPVIYFAVFWSATLKSKRRFAIAHAVVGLWCCAVWPLSCGVGLVVAPLASPTDYGWPFNVGIVAITAILSGVACRSWIPVGGIVAASVVAFTPSAILGGTTPIPTWTFTLLLLSWHLISGIGLFVWAVQERRKPRITGACPQCGYDLRGLGGRPCPECGGARGHWPDSPSDGGTG